MTGELAIADRKFEISEKGVTRAGRSARLTGYFLGLAVCFFSRSRKLSLVFAEQFHSVWINETLEKCLTPVAVLNSMSAEAARPDRPCEGVRLGCGWLAR